jgi:phospholipid/cholesterol/gamma-HCH transport system ATP-binding protein
MISLKNVTKRYNGTTVLDGVNLTITAGKTTAIIGESGCGKTVLLKSIIGLIPVDSGSILVDTEDIVKVSRSRLFEIRKKFGMLFQSAALFDSLTVAENVALPLREHSGLTEDAVKTRIMEILESLGLKGSENLLPASLSGGMKKRVGLARALVYDPDYILYDEPTTGLDPLRAEMINRLINETQNQRKITSLIVTHDMKSVFEIADRIAMLHEGRIRFEGKPDEIVRCRDPLVMQFIKAGHFGQYGQMVTEA